MNEEDLGLPKKSWKSSFTFAIRRHVPVLEFRKQVVALGFKQTSDDSNVPNHQQNAWQGQRCNVHLLLQVASHHSHHQKAAYDAAGIRTCETIEEAPVLVQQNHYTHAQALKNNAAIAGIVHLDVNSLCSSVNIN